MNIIKNIVTLFYIGYLPAPGTCGSLVAFSLIYIFKLNVYSWYGLLSLFVAVVSFFMIQRSLHNFKHKDPSEIVLDEFVGCFMVFCCHMWSASTMFLGFVIYRLFDIYKPLGIKKIERLPGAYGIILDDVIAGLFANIVVRCLCYVI